MEDVNFNQFSDRFSPMLVKELRQELRTRSFVFGFMLVQGALFLSVLVSMSSPESSGTQSFGESVFWFTVFVPLLFSIPRRGAVSSNKETEAGLLDLVLLTPLSPWKMLFGKWITCTMLAALFMVSVLPYAFLRFFLGSISLPQTAISIVALFVASSVFSAIAIGTSASVKKKRGGIGMTIFLFIVLSWGATGLGSFIFGRHGIGSGGTAEMLKMLVVLSSFGFVISVQLLQMGASRISPPGDNNALLQRGTALLSGVALIILTAVFDMQEAGYAFLAAVAGIACFAALLEEPQYVWSIYEPFCKLGARGKLFLKFLTPGWQSGLNFVLLCFLIAIVITLAEGAKIWEVYWLAVLGLSFFIQPIVVLDIFSMPVTIRAYVTLQIGLGFVGVVFGSLAREVGGPFYALASFFPSGLVVLIDNLMRKRQAMRIVPYMTILLLVMLIYLHVAKRAHWRKIEKLEREHKDLET